MEIVRRYAGSFAETFNASLLVKCLNVKWFASLVEAQGLLEAWRQDYNKSRPHSALNDLTPAERPVGSTRWGLPSGPRPAGTSTSGSAKNPSDSGESL